MRSSRAATTPLRGSAGGRAKTSSGAFTARRWAMSYPCDHLTVAAKRTSAVAPSGPGCEECLRSGSEWVHLRLCLACGHVGCCDQSEHRHSTLHFRTTGHPVIGSFEPGED